MPSARNEAGSWCTHSKYLVNEWVKRSQTELPVGSRCKGGGEKQGCLVVRTGDAVPWVRRMPLASDLGLECPPPPSCLPPRGKEGLPMRSL